MAEAGVTMVTREVKGEMTIHTQRTVGKFRWVIFLFQAIFLFFVL